MTKAMTKAMILAAGQRYTRAPADQDGAQADDPDFGQGASWLFD